MDRRVVVTGMGAITPLGNDVNTFWNSLLEGKSGAGEISRFDASEYSTRIAAEVKDFDPTTVINRKEVRRTDLYTQYALVAVDEAIKSAGFSGERLEDDRFGVIIGSGIGGIETLVKQHTTLLNRGPSKVSPFFIVMMIADIASGRAAIKYGLKGPNYTTTSACASAGHAIGDGFNLIKMGMADRMIVGGAEAPIVPLSVAGFCSNRALSERNDDPVGASRPFDSDRDGFVMGEGSGILVIESLESAKARNATIYAEIVSFGASADAFHITAPPEDGEGACRAMKNALTYAGLTPEHLGYVNTHGTSTPTGDIAELNAIKALCGSHAEKLKINSTKSMTGHLLGAAAGVESIATILSLYTGKIHRTLNLENPDPGAEGLDLVANGTIDHQVEYAISNSFGFGGHNCSLLFKRFNG